MSKELAISFARRKRPILAAFAGVASGVFAIEMSGYIADKALGALIDQIATGGVSSDFMQVFEEKPLKAIQTLNSPHLQSTYMKGDLLVTALQAVGAYYLAVWIGRKVSPDSRRLPVVLGLIGVYAFFLLIAFLYGEWKGFSPDVQLQFLEWGGMIALTLFAYRFWTTETKLSNTAV